MELESSTAALMYFGEKYIEAEGLRKEFEGLVKDYYAHNTEVLGEYTNPSEQMDKAVSKFHETSGTGSTMTFRKGEFSKFGSGCLFQIYEVSPIQRRKNSNMEMSCLDYLRS